MPATIEAEDSTVIARIGGLRVGRIGVSTQQFQWGAGVYVKTAGIGGVGTEERFRCRGIATAMMKKARELSAERGFSFSGLFTDTQIVAHRLYRHFKFVDAFVTEWASKPPKASRRRVSSGVVRIRPYKRGDEVAAVRVFERAYSSFIGPCKKEPGRWIDRRSKTLEADPEGILIAENETGVVGYATYFKKWKHLPICCDLCVQPNSPPWGTEDERDPAG